MKTILFVILLALSSGFVFAQQPQLPQERKQTQSQLAIAYYNARDYEKAIPLLLEVYNTSRNKYYYRLYLNCFIQTERFEEAEQLVRKELTGQNSDDTEMLVYLGYLLEKQDKMEEAGLKYNEAVEKVPVNKGGILTTANGFLQFAKYDYAEKIYLKGRRLLSPEQFNNELARVYLYQRKYNEMLDEYLDLLRSNEKYLASVQSSMSSAMRIDIDNGLLDKFKETVLKRIQAEPNILSYNRLLVWLFLQENKFSSALRQVIALDKRTGNEDGDIYQLGTMALRNREYADAEKAFEYVLQKGNNNQFYIPSLLKNIEASYLKFEQQYPKEEETIESLDQKFASGIETIGLGVQTLQTLVDYGHFLGFYANNFDKAIEVLEKGLQIPRLKPEQLGAIKTEMADIYVYKNDPWEATLLYSQVIDANKNNSLGDDVKLKKAKLGYYTGNFSWAKAQLDVLKASTSKLTANDAMELSLFIGNNLSLDTTALPLEMFARADLAFFQNKDSLALTILDMIAEIYPYHSLIDDILYRKSKIAAEKQDYEQAAENLLRICEEFSYDLLGDDALFDLAELYNYHLDKKEKARDLYKQMLTDFPGSVFVEESRTQYRELREVYPEKETESKEGLFMKAIDPNEFE